ncbi:substrate-binding domain-containing protein [Endothiovibrio diazotrophicus]
MHHPRLAAILALLSSLALAAPPPEPPPAPRTTATRLVGFAQDNLANDWRLAQVREMEQALADEPGVRFIYSDAGGSTAQQVLDIEEMIARRVDVLVTSPRDSRALAPAVAAARNAGIPVVLLTRRVSSDHYTAFVGLDDREIARRAAERMAERLHARGQERGRVLILQGLPNTTTAKARTEGFLAGIAAHPEMQVVALKAANYLRADAIRAVEETVAEGIVFDAVFAQSDSMASGARLALRRLGVDPRSLVIVGIDYIGEAREAIRSGEQDASFTYPTCGAEGAQTVMRILHGETVAKERLVPSRMVTRENVERVEPIF